MFLKIIRLKKEKETTLTLKKKANVKKIISFMLGMTWKTFLQKQKQLNQDLKKEDFEDLKKKFVKNFCVIQPKKQVNVLEGNFIKQDGNIIKKEEIHDINHNWEAYFVYLNNARNEVLNLKNKDLVKEKNFKGVYLNFLILNFYFKKSLILQLFSKKDLSVYFLKSLKNNLKKSILYMWKDNIFQVLYTFSNRLFVNSENLVKVFQSLQVFNLNAGALTLNFFYGFTDSFFWNNQRNEALINCFMSKEIFKKVLYFFIEEQCLLTQKCCVFSYLQNIMNILLSFNNIIHVKVKNRVKNILSFKSNLFYLFFFNFIKKSKAVSILKNNFKNFFYTKQLKYFFNNKQYFLNSVFLKKKWLKTFKYNFEKYSKKSLKNKVKSFYFKKSVYKLKNFRQNYKLKKNQKAQNIVQRKVSLSFLYIIKRIEEKILRTSESKVKEELLKIRMFLFQKWNLKLKKQRCTNFSLVGLKKLRKFNAILRLKWEKIIEILFFKLIKNFKGIQARKKTLIAFSKIYKKLRLKKKKNVSKVKVNKSLFKQNFFSWKVTKRKVGIFFKQKKLVKKNNYLSFKRQKELLYFLLNRKISVFYINALSLSRFGFLRGITKKSSNVYLQSIEREMIDRYKYVAIYIKDLVKISFISLFLKKATFLANFIAFQIEKLPRNRKETKFIRFIIKVVKIFAAQRKEMNGLRIKFKGRVNRWRRTKSIIGERGVLYFYTIDTRIEYGSSKAITRKGALGISIWLAYNPIFKQELLSTLIDYQKYSKYLRWKSLTNYYTQFKMLKN